MIAEFINIHDPRWRQLLAQAPHDFYHLPEYIAFAARYEDAEPTAFYAQDEQQKNTLLIPLLIRRLPEELNDGAGWRDAVSPYGFPSPVLYNPNLDAAQSGLPELLRAYIMLCQDQKILSTFIRLHPLLALNLEALSQIGTVIHHGQTIYIDLSQTEDALWSDTRKDHRTGIIKLESAGFKAHHNCWDEFDAFIEIYQATMEKLDAASFYRFSANYFKDMRAALQRHLHLFTVVSPTGDISAAGLFVQTNEIVQFHLSGSHPEYRKHAPSKLMLHAVRRWAKDAGCHFLHLGGGLGASESSLFAFKAGFSKLRAEFHTLRIITDQAEYQRLVQKKLQICENTEGAGNYFPEYRIPC